MRHDGGGKREPRQAAISRRFGPTGGATGVRVGTGCQQPGHALRATPMRGAERDAMMGLVAWLLTHDDTPANE